MLRAPRARNIKGFKEMLKVLDGMKPLRVLNPVRIVSVD